MAMYRYSDILFGYEGNDKSMCTKKIWDLIYDIIKKLQGKIT